jgi:hypothetical protein
MEMLPPVSAVLYICPGTLIIGFLLWSFSLSVEIFLVLRRVCVLTVSTILKAVAIFLIEISIFLLLRLLLLYLIINLRAFPD